MEQKLCSGSYRVVFLNHVGTMSALFCEIFVQGNLQWACEYRFGRLKWRLVDGKIYSSISRITKANECSQLLSQLESEGYLVTSVLSQQVSCPIAPSYLDLPEMPRSGVSLEELLAEFLPG